MSRAFPLTLNNDLLVDGERAFVLALTNASVSFAPIDYYTEPSPRRKSRMKTAMYLVLDDTVKEGFGFRISVRSPFPEDLGEPFNAPLILVSSSQDFAAARNVLINPLGDNPTQWDGTGSLAEPAPGFSATFNGKAIPNWSYEIILGNEVEESLECRLYFLLDFSHSIV